LEAKSEAEEICNAERKSEQVRAEFRSRKCVRQSRPLVALGVAVLLWFISLAENSSTTPDDQGAKISRAAIEKFWTIYRENDYAAIPEVQKRLETAIRFDPDNPTRASRSHSFLACRRVHARCQAPAKRVSV
jgi:hypothetical protein